MTGNLLTKSALAAAFALSTAVSAGAQQADQPVKEAAIVVTTLGTGAPVLSPLRFSQSTLVEAGAHRLLFDAGRGAVVRLAQAGIQPSSVEHVFFTHYHFDHTIGFDDFWLSSWLPAGGARSEALQVIGPTGAADLVAGLQSAYADDIAIRIADQDLPQSGTEIEVTEFTEDGVVFDQGGVTVTAFAVNHGELITPNFAYKIEYDGHSVVISGDTQKDDRIIEMATGADLLLHEVGAARPELAERPPIQKILAHHTLPEEAGEVFAAAAPRLAAYTHLVLLGRPGIAPLSDAELIEATRATYDGPLVVAEDLMRFEIGDAGVNVVKFEE
ncbi:MBL fold metallo-hydrolase [Paracoccus aurantiacus]|uniref:MBL fold metallo-hydrolase n=1 Tax=Paracoccus aurantiacus TaxID=2599412 RepID=A0A5C6RZB1_9RHOB|nr:MBL fold metallo-hydrolase [Paracoccus aurantiacus]TXB67434.1 MBL fold metallo-hydrolase [Paracoccus aurantiacus]